MHGIEAGGYNLRAPELEESKASIELTRRHRGKIKDVDRGVDEND